MPVTSRPRTRLEPISMRSRSTRRGMIGLARRPSSVEECGEQDERRAADAERTRGEQAVFAST